MEALLDYIEDLNFAEDFQKMGGLELLMFALDSKHDDVVWRAGECLATAVQNEAKLQMYVLELGAIGKVLQLLDETASEKVVLKMIRALSCLASANATVVEVFLSVGGLKTLTAAMERHADRTKVQLKTAFFLAGLPETFNAFAQHASEAGLIEVFVKIVKGSSEAMLWECVLRMLTNLCATSNCCIIDLQKEALNIKGLLGNRSAFIQSLDADDRPGHEEEERHIKQLHTYLAMTVWASFVSHRTVYLRRALSTLCIVSARLGVCACLCASALVCVRASAPLPWCVCARACACASNFRRLACGIMPTGSLGHPWLLRPTRKAHARVHDLRLTLPMYALVMWCRVCGCCGRWLRWLLLRVVVGARLAHLLL